MIEVVEMTRADILSKVRGILSDIVEEPNLRLTETMAAEDVTDWDSTNHVRLIVAIESEFDIRFETSEIGAPDDVGQLIDLIDKKLRTRG